jgi:hypothetical protein
MSHGTANRAADGHRLVVELTSVYVACDDCGRSTVLGLPDLFQASQKGVQTYSDLCRKFLCRACPPQPPSARNLTVRPRWLPAANPSNGSVENNFMYGKHAV